MHGRCLAECSRLRIRIFDTMFPVFVATFKTTNFISGLIPTLSKENSYKSTVHNLGGINDELIDMQNTV